MSKSKTHGKDKKKSAQLVLRVEKAERDAFVALCEALDTTAAREIRRFMREMVAAHASTEALAPEAEVATPAEPAAEAPAPKSRKKAAPVEAPAEPAAEAPAPKPRKKSA